jgi:hypothetical protein
VGYSETNANGGGVGTEQVGIEVGAQNTQRFEIEIHGKTAKDNPKEYKGKKGSKRRVAWWRGVAWAVFWDHDAEAIETRRGRCAVEGSATMQAGQIDVHDASWWRDR